MVAQLDPVKIKFQFTYTDLRTLLYVREKFILLTQYTLSGYAYAPWPRGLCLTSAEWGGR